MSGSELLHSIKKARENRYSDSIKDEMILAKEKLAGLSLGKETLGNGKGKEVVVQISNASVIVRAALQTHTANNARELSPNPVLRSFRSESELNFNAEVNPAEGDVYYLKGKESLPNWQPSKDEKDVKLRTENQNTRFLVRHLSPPVKTPPTIRDFTFPNSPSPLKKRKPLQLSISSFKKIKDDRKIQDDINISNASVSASASARSNDKGRTRSDSESKINSGRKHSNGFLQSTGSSRARSTNPVRSQTQEDYYASEYKESAASVSSNSDRSTPSTVSKRAPWVSLFNGKIHANGIHRHPPMNGNGNTSSSSVKRTVSQPVSSAPSDELAFNALKIGESISKSTSNARKSFTGLGDTADSMSLIRADWESNQELSAKMKSVMVDWPSIHDVIGSEPVDPDFAEVGEVNSAVLPSPMSPTTPGKKKKLLPPALSINNTPIVSPVRRSPGKIIHLNDFHSTGATPTSASPKRSSSEEKDDATSTGIEETKFISLEEEAQLSKPSSPTVTRVIGNMNGVDNLDDRHATLYCHFHGSEQPVMVRCAIPKRMPPRPPI